MALQSHKCVHTELQPKTEIHAGFMTTQSAACGIDIACGVLLLHAVSMQVTALLTHDAVLPVFCVVSRLWALSMQQTWSKHHVIHMKQSAVNIARQCDTGNKSRVAKQKLLKARLCIMHHSHAMSCKCNMPTQMWSDLAFAYWALLATMRK